MTPSVTPGASFLLGRETRSKEEGGSSGRWLNSTARSPYHHHLTFFSTCTPPPKKKKKKTPGLSRPLRRLPTTIIPIAPTTPTTPISAFFGVGAPEAILVGVVALLVFGPKGLAEAVKAVGATLRTFQPTIRELASVSSELRSTLEEQIGLDDIKAELNAAVAPLPPPATKKVVEKTKKEGGEEGREAKAGGDEEEGANAEGEDDGDGDGEREIFDPRPSLSEYAASMGAEKIDPDIEAKRAAAAAAAWGSAGAIPQVLSSSDGSGDAPSSSSSSSSAPVQGAALEAALAAAAASSSPSPPAAAAPAKSLDGLSIEELEAELARRRGA